MNRRTQIAVRVSIRGEDLRPQEVADQLGLTPSKWQHEPGDEFGVEGDERRRADGFCAFSSHAEVSPDADIEQHASWMLDRLAGHEDLLAQWVRDGWSVRFQVILVMNTRSGRILASSRSMRRLADLGLAIEWTMIHAPDHAGFETM